MLFSTDTLAGDRDRALLLVDYYFAGRRSELVALDVEDLVEVAEGLRIRVHRSKTARCSGRCHPVTTSSTT